MQAWLSPACAGWLVAAVALLSACGGSDETSAPPPTVPSVAATSRAEATIGATATAIVTQSPPSQATATVVPPTATSDRTVAQASPTATLPAPATATPVPPTALPRERVTDEELIGLAELVFPAVGPVAYASCDNLVNATCPFTERLESRLADPNVNLCRCQNSSTTREIEALPGRRSDGAGVVRVTVFNGGLRHDLVVVRSPDGGWLVDDEYCADRPDTSIHVYAGPC